MGRSEVELVEPNDTQNLVDFDLPSVSFVPTINKGQDRRQDHVEYVVLDQRCTVVFDLKAYEQLGYQFSQIAVYRIYERSDRTRSRFNISSKNPAVALKNKIEKVLDPGKYRFQLSWAAKRQIMDEMPNICEKNKRTEIR